MRLYHSSRILWPHGRLTIIKKSIAHDGEPLFTSTKVSGSQAQEVLAHQKASLSRRGLSLQHEGGHAQCRCANGPHHGRQFDNLSLLFKMATPSERDDFVTVDLSTVAVSVLARVRPQHRCIYYYGKGDRVLLRPKHNNISNQRTTECTWPYYNILYIRSLRVFVRSSPQDTWGIQHQLVSLSDTSNRSLVVVFRISR